MASADSTGDRTPQGMQRPPGRKLRIMSLPSAADILAKCAEAYASCRTYQDTGEVRRTMTGSRQSIRHTQRLPFRTAFERPSRFLFEYRDMDLGPTEEWAGGFACLKDGRTTCWTSFSGACTGDLANALAALTGVSGSSASFVPTLLGLAPAYSPLPRAGTATLIAEEQVDGHECFRIRGKRRGGILVDLWVDCATGLVRRADSSQEFNAASRRRMRDDLKRRLVSIPENDPHRAELESAVEHMDKEATVDFVSESTMTFHPGLDAPLDPSVFDVSPPA